MTEQPLVKVSLGHVLRNGRNWLEFCNEFGYSEWAVNEGGEGVKVTLPLERAKYYGVV